MTTLMIEDIPLIEKLSDGGARKIVGAASATPMPVEPDGGIGDTPKMMHWDLPDLLLGFPRFFPRRFAYAV